MKIRFYVDLWSEGIRLADVHSWVFSAISKPHSEPLKGKTRVAFDVEMPPHLVMPAHDVMAPASAAVVIEEKKE